MTNDTCVTISGRPDILASFTATLPANVSVQNTTLDALYHCPIHISGARKQVMEDIVRRGIRFPSIADLKAPIRCTSTGKLIHSATESTSLVEMVVDMILVHPVRWDKIVASVVDALPESAVARLLNVGPGDGVTRVVERAFPKGRVSLLDLSCERDKFIRETSYAAEKAPIAIVGMSVNMPGGGSVSKLWEVLEMGINTISEASRLRFFQAVAQ
jgi:malonyl CoA-acyl carrier protein transacylase